uniref:Tetratricopeptide repeat protein 30B n=1 Tax=Macrostomum lignano TaxID=282301 RepID=A0A1I8HP92_9PLAT
MATKTEKDPYAFEDSVDNKLIETDDSCQDAASDLEVELGAPGGESLQQEQLLDSIGEAQRALDRFLGNQFESARAMMEPLAETSMYHSLGCSTICYMQASMTLEQPDIQRAVLATKRALRVCQRYRRPRNGLAMAAPLLLRLADFTDEQCHAELCYAELLLEKAVLTFAQDESLIAFVRAA